MTYYSVKQVREQILSKMGTVPKDSGYYRWWFPKEQSIQLLSSLTSVDCEKIVKSVINGEEYWLLYFGIANALNERMKWHICQKHSATAVKSGTLSTLRQTLSALQQLDMTVSECQVNCVMDRCYVEWDTTETKQLAEEVEKQELSTNYYPLNIQGNIVVPKAIIDELKRLRKLHKK